MTETTAIILAAGRGSRMGSDTPKQYMELCGKPLLYYALRAFEQSQTEELVLVVTKGDEAYVKEEIVSRFGISKVCAIVPGGEERYDSVYAGLQAAKGEYVLIHDSARAMITPEVIDHCIASVKQSGACVAGMPSKDTVKLVEEKILGGEEGTGDSAGTGGKAGKEGSHGTGGKAGKEGSEGTGGKTGKEGSGGTAGNLRTAAIVRETPDRSRVWIVQTPQCFLTSLVKGAYQRIYEELTEEERHHITDDAMVVEQMTDHPVEMIEGSYENSKVTTPEDVLLAEEILKRRRD